MASVSPADITSARKQGELSQNGEQLDYSGNTGVSWYHKGIGKFINHNKKYQIVIQSHYLTEISDINIS